MNATIRKYRPEDKDRVLDICAQTAIFGEPLERLFQDRKLFSKLTTWYYLTYEPDHCYVLTHNKTVVGYIMGCLNEEQYHKHRVNPLHVLYALFKYFTYDKHTKKVFKEIVLEVKNFNLKVPKDTGHLHINLMPGYRRIGFGQQLLEKVYADAKEKNLKNMYAMVFSTSFSIGDKFFEKCSFTVLDKIKTDIYSSIIKEPVYLLSMVKELQ